jgi:preprotein translocase subunit SecY
LIKVNELLSGIWRLPEVRRRGLFTLLMLALYRLGAHIPLPGVPRAALAHGVLQTSSNPVAGLIGVFTGGALNNLSVFALGIMPYITASIVLQLLTVAAPRLYELSREGERGQQKVNQYARSLTLVLALIQAVSVVLLFRSGALGASLSEMSPLDEFLNAVTMTAGAMLIMWLGELITRYGIGNGPSLLIFCAIISRAPQGIQSLHENLGPLGLAALSLAALGVVVGIIFVNEARRKIPISYARHRAGSRTARTGSTYLPIKLNMAGVIPIIFASSLLVFPATVLRLIAGDTGELAKVSYFFRPEGVPYLAIYALLVFAFTYFYTAVQFDPGEHAADLARSGGYVPGVRPGRPTTLYLNRIVVRITLVGALFLAAIALLPYLAADVLHVQLFIGGTSLLIVVGVALDAVRQAEGQLAVRHYEGFLSKNRPAAARQEQASG